MMNLSVATTSSSSGRININPDVEDVIVDGNEPEESVFGPSQYTESDLEGKAIKHKHNEKELAQSQVATVNSSGDVDIKIESGGLQCDSNVSTSDAEPSSKQQLIEELKNRIRQLETENGESMVTTVTDTEDYKCLICLVSIYLNGRKIYLT